MPFPIVPIGLGVLGGIAIEYVTTAGKPTKKGLVISGTVGAIPGVGLGVRGALSGATKLGKIGSYLHRIEKADDIKTLGLATVHPGSRVFLGGTAYAIASGAAASHVVGMAYDRISHSSSGAGTRSNPGSTTTKRSRGIGSKSSHRTSRRSPSGRRRKRCTHRDSRGRRCLRPAGHSGRHRYQ